MYKPIELFSNIVQKYAKIIKFVKNCHIYLTSVFLASIMGLYKRGGNYEL